MDRTADLESRRLLLTLESCRPDQLDKLLAIAGKANLPLSELVTRIVESTLAGLSQADRLDAIEQFEQLGIKETRCGGPTSSARRSVIHSDRRTRDGFTAPALEPDETPAPPKILILLHNWGNWQPGDKPLGTVWELSHSTR
jgi:hypothetical protein